MSRPPLTAQRTEEAPPPSASTQPIDHLELAEPEWNVALLFPARGEWTEEEYLALPDERRVELSDGCLEILPLPTEQHQLILAYLFRALDDWVRARKLGIVLTSGIPVRLWTGKMREPDVVYMAAGNAGRRKGKYWEGADLAVEIVNPGDPKRDLVIKHDEYARAGVSEYWIVDPLAVSVAVYRLEGDAYALHGSFGPGEVATSVLLPGFSVDVRAMLSYDGS
jgi:Uma2 family endonuclease